jgi:hypothetical protein
MKQEKSVMSLEIDTPSMAPPTPLHFEISKTLTLDSLLDRRGPPKD